MPMKKFKPTTPGQRSARIVGSAGLTKKRPEKKLVRPLKNKAGRSRGRISVRHRGGGHKRLYRVVDFLRYDKVGIPARVVAIEYDPNRSANLALLEYNDQERRYILAPLDLKTGDMVEAGPSVKVRLGNALPLRSIPIGVAVHNIELYPEQGAKLVRSAGSGAVVTAKEEDWVHVKLRSGEVRMIPADNYATVGQVGNLEHARRVLGKAGRKRHLGFRPSVRGTAMPAGEHAHGGGEGRTGPGGPPRTYKGKPAHGVRTRKKGKKSNKYIVKTKRGR